MLLALLLAACHPAADTAAPAPLDLTERLGAGEVRAGQLGEHDGAALIGGTSGESRAGDFLLYNDRARFVVRGLRQGDWYVGEPGALIDLDVVRPDGEADRDGLDELLTMAGFGRLFVAEHVEVLADGRDGGAAVVRARGHDAAIPYIEGMLELPGMFPPNGVEIAATFTLEPDSPALTVRTEVRNTSGDALRLDTLDAGMTDVASHAVFAPGAGFSGEVPEGDRPMLAMVSRMNDQAWAIYRDDGDMPEGLTALGAGFDMLLASGDVLDLDEGETGAWTRRIGVARDLSALEEHRRALQGLPTGFVEGAVTEEGSGEPVAGAPVFLTDAAGIPWTLAVTDRDGAFRIAAAPGEAFLVAVGDATNEWMELDGGPGAYGVHAGAEANARALAAYLDPEAAAPAPLADGHGRGEPVAVAVEEGATVVQDLTLPERGWVRIRTADQDGAPLPAVVHLAFSDGIDPQPPDERLGEDRPSGGARKAAWVVDGEALVPIPPGTYDLTAHHGFRYELGRAAGVVVEAGATAEADLTLVEAVEADGWVAIDTHSHGSPSIDGECTIEERLVTAAANDLQVHVSSDHDHVADYRPVAAALGLDARLATVPGDEISSNVRGHHNIYLLEPDPALPNGGAPRWWDEVQSTCDLYDEWHERAGEGGLLQVNHGRETGMFAAAEYDPVTGEAGEPDRYCADFDAMELLNSKGYGEAEEQLLDFVSHLDRGYRPVAVGVSDSHGRLSGPGFPRTLVDAGLDRVTAGDVPAVMDALRAQRAQVCGGPFLGLTASDGHTTVGPGETLAAATATLAIEVLAPSWIPVERVRLLGPGGAVVQEWTVDPGVVKPPLWFSAEVQVAPVADAWYLVRADGSADLWPAWSGAHPFSATNPVFVDVP